MMMMIITEMKQRGRHWRRSEELPETTYPKPADRDKLPMQMELRRLAQAHWMKMPINM